MGLLRPRNAPGWWVPSFWEGLLSRAYPGEIYPINRSVDYVHGIRAYSEVGALPDSPDLAILTIPAEAVEHVISGAAERE